MEDLLFYADILSSSAGCQQDNLDRFAGLLLNIFVLITNLSGVLFLTLNNMIRRAFWLVTPQMLENVWGNMTRRLKKTVERMKGYLVENLMI